MVCVIDHLFYPSGIKKGATTLAFTLACYASIEEVGSYTVFNIPITHLATDFFRADINCSRPNLSAKQICPKA